MSEAIPIIPPHQVGYRVARLLAHRHDEPGWPYAVGAIARKTEETYRNHYDALMGISKDILHDEAVGRILRNMQEPDDAH